MCAMGTGADKYTTAKEIDRSRQDELAAPAHERAATAAKDGRFDEESAPGSIVSYGQVAGPDPSWLHQPSRAIKAALAKVGKDVKDVDLLELNEAFAAVGLASMDDPGISDDVVNVNAGAIALGHPIGMS